MNYFEPCEASKAGWRPLAEAEWKNIVLTSQTISDKSSTSMRIRVLEDNGSWFVWRTTSDEHSCFELTSDNTKLQYEDYLKLCGLFEEISQFREFGA